MHSLQWKIEYLKAGATKGTQTALMATATPPIPAATKTILLLEAKLL